MGLWAHFLNRYVAWGDTPKIRILHAAVNAPGHQLGHDDATAATGRRSRLRAEHDLIMLVAWGWLEPVDDSIDDSARDGMQLLRMPDDRVDLARRLARLCPYV